jgi:hypothetical protein
VAIILNGLDYASGRSVALTILVCQVKERCNVYKIKAAMEIAAFGVLHLVNNCNFEPHWEAHLK